MPRVLVFDLDETLINSRETILDFFRELYADVGVPFPEDNSEIFYTAPESGFLEFLFPDPDQLERARAFKRNFGRERYLCRLTLKPFAKETLAILHTRYRLALATNRGASTPEVMQRLEIADYFEMALHARALAEAKPHPLIWQTICATLKVLPDDTLMIGDSQVDVETARNGGAKVVIVGRNPAGAKADFQIPHLGALPDLLTQIGY